MNLCQSIISAATPKGIAFADKPLRLGGKIENLALEEFQKRIGCVFREGITKDVSTKIPHFSENITGYLSSSELKNQVKNILNSPCDKLVICNMGKFGYGVFASKDIPKNTVVATYAGKIMSTNKISNEADHAIGYWGTNMSFSTLQHRGIGSFMQHLPEEPKFKDAKTFSEITKMLGQSCSEEDLKLNIEFYSTLFTANSKELVATENVNREYLEFNKAPLIAMVTQRDIKSGEQLGFNYGRGYWLTRNYVPSYFDKNGKALSRDLYKKTFGQLKFENFSYLGEYGPLIESLKKKNKVIYLNDEKNRKQEVSNCELLCLLLHVNGIAIKIINPVQILEGFPTKIAVTDENGEMIASFNISDKENQQSLLELGSFVGNTIFQKKLKEPTYVITKDWLLQVNEMNPKGITLLVDLLDDKSEKNFWMKVNKSH